MELNPKPAFRLLLQDVREKALLKVATRGVVRLFNAVSKAQKQNLEERATGGRKARFRVLSGRV